MPDERWTKFALGRRKDWFNAMIRWERLWWFLIVSIGAGSAFVASELSTALRVREATALFVAICSALLAVLRPEIRARTSREAWIILDLALCRYRQMPGDVIEALRKGEERISGGHFPSEGAR